MNWEYLTVDNTPDNQQMNWRVAAPFPQAPAQNVLDRTTMVPLHEKACAVHQREGSLAWRH